MEDSGLADFGSHTHTHPDMNAIASDSFIEEVKKSDALLKENLKRPVMIFSYPKGRFKKEHLDYLEKFGFDAGVGVKEGLVRPGDNIFFLNRNFIYSMGGFSQFKGKLGRGVEFYNFLKIWKK
jgi:peptidoglycan/xylan/chitin deacetylase (PgdA/CDA1 family)